MTNKVPSSFEEEAIELLAEYSARLDLTIIDGQRPTDAVIAKFTTLATRQAEALAEQRVREARQAYESKVQDFAVETFIHSKIAEWAESYRHPGDDQNPYVGLEGAGYASAQEHMLGLLSKWRIEASAHLKAEASNKENTK